MPKGFTYFCTDKHGHTYSRYSAGHAAPRYATAAVSRKGEGTGPVTKACVSYSKGEATGFMFNGWTYETVPVRAYPGRHSVEPQNAREAA